MTQTAIHIEGLSKRYRIGVRESYQTIRDAMVRLAGAPVRAVRSGLRSNSDGERPGMFWALQDISFDVQEGEVIGIIGRNGAGKSTLLKILTGITEPTRGFADISGRVGSLLEVGTGFHGELTGRENIYMNGAILGMRRYEIKQKFDEIIAFAEVEQFLDTPVKRYSSGMYMRLAFAVAAHLDPEILLIDEVLAVGDAAFQKKCLGKMSTVAQQGRTVLFVSHNMSTVQSLCSKVIWLDQGKIVDQGTTSEVVRRYLQSAMSAEAAPLNERNDRTGDGSVRINGLRIESLDDDGIIRTSSRLKVVMKYTSDRPLVSSRVYVTVCDLGHAGIFALDSDATGGLPATLPAHGTLTCITDPINLTPGRCYLDVGILKGTVPADHVEYAVYFDVEPDTFFEIGKMPRRSWVLTAVQHQWSINGEGS